MFHARHGEGVEPSRQGVEHGEGVEPSRPEPSRPSRHERSRLWKTVLLVAVLAGGGGSVFAEEFPTYLAFGDTFLKIAITDFDADGFTFTLEDTGAESELKWWDVAESEAARLRQLVGLVDDGDSDSPRTGKTIVAECLHLASGKTIVGVVISEGPDFLVMDTTVARKFKIHRADIKKREALTVYMEDIYSPEEIYEREINTRPPKTAQDHYELAVLCQNLGLYQEAKGHLEICAELDERYKERVAEHLLRLDKLIDEKSFNELYNEARRARNAGHFQDALDIIGKIEKYYSEYPKANDIISERDEIMEERKESIRRNVVTGYYSYHDRFIQKIATGKIADGYEIPGKIVYLKDGRIVRGILDEDTAELLILKQDHREYRIEKEGISKVDDINMNTEKVKPTLEQCRSYVTDPEGGITADIRSELAKRHGITTDEVKELWDDRLKQVVEFKPGGGTHIERRYTSLRSASYGPGIWIRGGGGGIISGDGDGRNNGSSTVETDPEKWWLRQFSQTRIKLLKALSVEALMNVEQEIKVQCPQCGGKGVTIVIQGGSAAQSSICSYCRGLGYTLTLKYR